LPSPPGGSPDHDIFVRALGRLSINVKNGAAVKFRSRSTEELAAYLIAHRNQPVNRETLAALLWPKSSRSQSLANLRINLSWLKSQLKLSGDRFEHVGSRFLQFRLEDYEFDLAIFDHLMRRNNPTWLDLILQGVSRKIFEGINSHWLLAIRTEFDSKVERVIVAIFESLLKEEQQSQALEALRKLIAMFPGCETHWQKLLILQAEMGDRAALLATFHGMANQLKRVSGCSPGRETCEIYEQLLTKLEPDYFAKLRIARKIQSNPGVFGGPIPFGIFVGRESETKELSSLIERERCVVVKGLPGVGKSSLVLEVSHRLGQSGQTIWRCDCSHINQAEVTSYLISRVLGVSEWSGVYNIAQLFASFEDKSGILVFDSCDRIIEEVAQVSEEILAHSSGIKIIIVARTAVNLNAAKTLELRPMEYPSEDFESELDLAAWSGTKLMLAKLKDLKPEKRFRPNHCKSICKIVRATHGIPLGIGLAASRFKSRSLEIIARNLTLDSELETRMPKSSRSGNATTQGIRLSLSLLKPKERRQLAQIATIRGWLDESLIGVLLDNAKHDELDHLLDSLQGASLIETSSNDSHQRWKLPEPVREYCRTYELTEVLVGKGHRAYVDWLICELEIADQAVRGRDKVQGLDRLGQLVPAIRQNIQICKYWNWSNSLVRTLSLSWQYWESRGILDEGRELVLECLTEAGNSCANEHHAWLLAGAASLAWLQGDIANAKNFADAAIARASFVGSIKAQALGMQTNIAITSRSLELIAQDKKVLERAQKAMSLWRECGDLQGELETKCLIGHLHYHCNEPREGRIALHEALHEANSAGLIFLLPRIYSGLGNIEASQKNLTVAYGFYSSAVEKAKKNRTMRIEAVVQGNIGILSDETNDLDQMRSGFEACLPLWAQIGNQRQLAHARFNIARIDAEQGHFKQSLKGLDFAESVFTSLRDDGLLEVNATGTSTLGLLSRDLPMVQRALARLAKCDATVNQSQIHKFQILRDHCLLAIRFGKFAEAEESLLQLTKIQTQEFKISRIIDQLECYSSICLRSPSNALHKLRLLAATGLDSIIYGLAALTLVQEENHEVASYYLGRARELTRSEPWLDRTVSQYFATECDLEFEKLQLKNSQPLMSLEIVRSKFDLEFLQHLQSGNLAVQWMIPNHEIGDNWSYTI